jgi:predicted kinase
MEILGEIFMTVYLLVGPVGAGKTVAARALERREAALRLSIDEWMIRLYGHHMSRELFEARRAACMELLVDLSERAAARGLNVVLDCGFWKRSQRHWVRERLTRAGFAVEVWHFEVDADERWKRVAARNEALPPRLTGPGAGTARRHPFFARCALRLRPRSA